MSRRDRDLPQGDTLFEPVALQSRRPTLPLPRRGREREGVNIKAKMAQSA